MNSINPAYRLGVDLGGTKIEAILMDPEGHQLLRERTITPRDADGPTEYENIRDAVHTLIQHTMKNVPKGCACTIGIGIPGTIDDRSGRVQNANTTGLIGHPFQQDLERLLDRPIAMENDANCFTLEQITDGYRRGDAACSTTFKQFLDDFGRCLGGLISILDPDAVVLGGGVSNIDELYTLGLEQVRRYAFHEHVETPVLKHQLGDSAGVIGAAWIGK